MRRRMMGPAVPSRIILIIIVSALISCASAFPPEKSKEGTASAMTAEKKEETDKTNSYCEIIACIGEVKDECEMRIGVMKNYDATIQQEGGSSYVLRIDKAISIEYLHDWMLQDSLSLARFKSGDKLFYRNYKQAHTEYYARFHSSLIRVTRTIRLDEQAPGYKFTFRQILLAAEALVHKNKAQLGAETLFAKRRLFQKEPTDTFFRSPIRHEDLY